MTRISWLQHEFVRHIPDTLEDGVLYVSIPFATVVHNCCCGCGSEVVTPLDPTDWRMVFDGKTISLYPSIGNWNFACQSHYWIQHNQVNWARRLSKKAIDKGRVRDRMLKMQHFGEIRLSLWQSVLKWLRGLT